MDSDIRYVEQFGKVQPKKILGCYYADIFEVVCFTSQRYEIL